MVSQIQIYEFQFWEIENESKYLIFLKGLFFSQLKMICNKYYVIFCETEICILVKKFLDSEFKICETIWWAINETELRDIAFTNDFISILTDSS